MVDNKGGKWKGSDQGSIRQAQKHTREHTPQPQKNTVGNDLGIDGEPQSPITNQTFFSPTHDFTRELAEGQMPTVKLTNLNIPESYWKHYVES